MKILFLKTIHLILREIYKSSCLNSLSIWKRLTVYSKVTRTLFLGTNVPDYLFVSSKEGDVGLATMCLTKKVDGSAMKWC